MKKTTIITLTSIVGLASLILGGENIQALAKNSGDSEATVTLKKKTSEGGGGEVVDPTDPETTDPIIPPTDKPEIGDENASIVYYPDFDFGEHTYQLTKSATYDAIAPVFDTESGASKPMPNFLQVNNSPEIKSWKVSVKSSEFKPMGSSTGTLSGAEIQLKDVKVITSVGNEAKTSADKYTLTPGNSVTLGTYTKPEDDTHVGVNINSVIFGDVSEITKGEEDESGEPVNYNPGVQLTIPSGLSIKNTMYTADLEWTLEATI